MSKSELMAFAKGETLEKRYGVWYRVDKIGKIHIDSCSESAGRPNIWWGLCGTDVEKFKVTNEDIVRAIAEYLNEDVAKLNIAMPDKHVNIVTRTDCKTTFAHSEDEVDLERDYRRYKSE